VNCVNATMRQVGVCVLLIIQTIIIKHHQLHTISQKKSCVDRMRWSVSVQRDRLHCRRSVGILLTSFYQIFFTCFRMNVNIIPGHFPIREACATASLCRNGEHRSLSTRHTTTTATETGTYESTSNTFNWILVSWKCIVKCMLELISSFIWIMFLGVNIGWI
jgi:hypothetical protein